jgi:hypothetical protein
MQAMIFKMILLDENVFYISDLVYLLIHAAITKTSAPSVIARRGFFPTKQSQNLKSRLLRFVSIR